MNLRSKLNLSVIGPGILVAATGVGAGDLATATLSGATLGCGVLWAVIVGAGLKFVLNEGLTLIPISGLFLFNFSYAMKINGIVGALFIPMLAIALLQLNGNASLVGIENRNSRWTTALLLATLIVSLTAGAFQLLGN